MSLEVVLQHQFARFALDVSFSAPEGVTVLFGRSGSGKTTVVNAVAGLLRPQSGRIVLQGECVFDHQQKISVPSHRRRVGYVFQEGRLFPHLTVQQNLKFGQWFAPRTAKLTPVERVVTLLGIEHLLNRKPGALSGGEKQRVAIGRALLSGPRLLLMDEPLAALDDPRKAEILPYLERLRDETRIPILYVSHSLAEVGRLATTVVILENGHIVRSGPAAEVLSDPEVVPSLGIREAGALMAATVLQHHDDGLTELAVSSGRLLLPQCQAAPGSELRLRILAHEVILSLQQPTQLSALNQLPATVIAVHEGSGPGVMVALQSGTDRLLARLTRRSAQALGLAPGTPCYAIIKSVAIAQRDVGTGAPELGGGPGASS